MADIARETGVTAATVSLALRNDRRLSRATVARVQAAARRLGYRPNPLVSALMAQLHGQRTSDETPTLAYLNATRIFPHGRNFPTMQRYWDGASARAAELGYRLEEFWLHEPGLTPKAGATRNGRRNTERCDADTSHLLTEQSRRLGKVLVERGIVGIVLAPPDPDLRRLDMEWQHFAVAAIDHVFEHPDVHWSSANHFQGMWLALERLEQHGYRRVGLAMSRSVDRRVNHAWISAFCGYQAVNPKVPRVPPYVVADWNPWNPAAFAVWMRRQRPEVVVVSEDRMHGHLAEIGLRIPDDVGLVHLAVECAEIPCAGIDQRSELVGAAAVDIVVGQLHRNERGIPSPSRVVMVEGRWVDGPSVRTVHQPR